MSDTTGQTWDGFSGTSAASNLFSATATSAGGDSASKGDAADVKMPKVPKIYELDSVRKTIVLDELAIKNS